MKNPPNPWPTHKGRARRRARAVSTYKRRAAAARRRGEKLEPLTLGRTRAGA